MEVELDRAGSEPTATAAAPTSVDSFRIKVGDCLATSEAPPEGVGSEDVSAVDTVPCDQEHGGEVYAAFDLEDSAEYPGDKAVGDLADAGCLERFGEWVGVDYDDSRLEFYSFLPSEGSWTDLDDRQVLCVVFDPTGPMTGTAQGLDAAAALQPGTCVDQSFVPIACTAAHDTEVYAVVSLPEAPWPGQEALEAAADESCRADFEAYVGVSYEESALHYGYYTPIQEDWDAGDREVVCVIYAAEGQLTGSVRGTGQ